MQALLKSIQKEKLLKGLTLLYILSFAFQALFTNSTVQLPDIIFAVLFIVALISRTLTIPAKLSKTDILLLLWAASSIGVNLFVHLPSSLLQIGIQIYLFCVFFIFRKFFILWKEQFLTLVCNAFILMGLCASLCGMLGFLLYHNGIESNLVDIYYHYPYKGDTLRALGFTSSPTMLMELISTAILFLSERALIANKIKPKEIAAFIILIIGALLTYSKEMVLLLPAFCFLFMLRQKLSKSIKIVLIIVMIICINSYLFFTHFIILPVAQNEQLPVLQQTEYSTGKIVYENNHILILESSYFALKKVSIKIAEKHPLMGVGSGNYGQELNEMKLRAEFPKHIPLYDPHSTYFGMAAENGIPVLILLLLALAVLLTRLFKNKELFSHYRILALYAGLPLLLLTAISADILNYRHFWVLLGIASGIFTQSKPDSKSA